MAAPRDGTVTTCSCPLPKPTLWPTSAKASRYLADPCRLTTEMKLHSRTPSHQPLRNVIPKATQPNLGFGKKRKDQGNSKGP